MYNPDPINAESGMPKNELGFNDQTIRAAFVRKVFFLVAIMVCAVFLRFFHFFQNFFFIFQLGVVTVMCAVPFFHPPLQAYARHNMGLYLVALITFIVVYFVLMCCDGVRRTFPTKFAFLVFNNLIFCLFSLICTGVLTLAIGFITMVFLNRKIPLILN